LPTVECSGRLKGNLGSVFDMKQRRIIAGLALTAALAGCGSSSSSSSPSAYRADVNKLCAAGNAKVTAMPASTANTPAGLRKLYGVVDSTLAQVKAVKPPSSLRSQVQAWIATLDQAAANANQIVSDVQSGQTTQLRGLVAKAQSLDSQTNSEASALGLSECAKSPQPSGKG
jgi:hypothetical protein